MLQRPIAQAQHLERYDVPQQDLLRHMGEAKWSARLAAYVRQLAGTVLKVLFTSDSR